MLEALKLLTEMGAPAALAFVGVVAAVTIPTAIALGVRSSSRRNLEVEQVRARRDVQIAQAKGALVTLPKERDY